METDGITIHEIYNSKDRQVCEIIATVSADNLGAHDLGGFRKCFSSGRICRHCMCAYDELKHKYEESDFVQRTPSNYAKQLQSIQADASLSSVYGIASDCPLNQLAGFSAITSFPPDLMHDCYEGIIPNFMQFLMRTLADDRGFIRDINLRINAFQLDFDDRETVFRCPVLLLHGCQPIDLFACFSLICISYVELCQRKQINLLLLLFSLVSLMSEMHQNLMSFFTKVMFLSQPVSLGVCLNYFP